MTKDQFTLNYIKCPKCKNILDLSFVDKKCLNPLCNFYFKGLGDLLNKRDHEIREKSLEAYREKDEHKRLLVITAIKFNMARYLAHLVECDWGAHYNTLFKEFIKPYFDDLNALKIVLKSDAIRTDKDYIISKNGYRMFWDLYKYLDTIFSLELQDFLMKEFKEYYIKLRREKRKEFQEKMRKKELQNNPDLKRIKKLL